LKFQALRFCGSALLAGARVVDLLLQAGRCGHRAVLLSFHKVAPGFQFRHQAFEVGRFLRARRCPLQGRIASFLAPRRRGCVALLRGTLCAKTRFHNLLVLSRSRTGRRSLERAEVGLGGN